MYNYTSNLKQIYRDHTVKLFSRYRYPLNALLPAIVFWAIIQVTFAIPNSIVDDWMGWRQADTQTIAVNFLSDGSNILYPRINWGGAGPGYVEAEFQLYTFLIAQVMKLTGRSVWPGQLFSLLFIAVTSLVIYFSLRLRIKNETAALIGALTFVTSNGAVHLSTSIQPDSLCILAYALALWAFLKYVKNASLSALLSMSLSLILAALIKPTALNLGITEFFILLLGYRHLLKSPNVWLAWMTIITIIGLYLSFSFGFYQKFGNSFGVLGGDSKFPTLHGLLQPIHYLKLVYMTVAWGLGPAGTAAAIFLAAKKKIGFIEVSLIVGNAAAILIPMRYTVNRGFSPHYYIFTALLGSWLAALAYDLLTETVKRSSWIKLMPVAAAGLIFCVYGVHLFERMNPLEIYYDPDVTKLGYKLKEIEKQGSLAIVRSIANERERSTWGNRINNYEDPRIFYIADTRGWVVPYDAAGYEFVQKYVRLGADYYVEPFKKPVDSALTAWLENNGTLVFSGEFGRIYQFYHP